MSATNAILSSQKFSTGNYARAKNYINPYAQPAAVHTVRNVARHKRELNISDFKCTTSTQDITIFAPRVDFLSDPYLLVKLRTITGNGVYQGIPGQNLIKSIRLKSGGNVVQEFSKYSPIFNYYFDTMNLENYTIAKKIMGGDMDGSAQGGEIMIPLAFFWTRFAKYNWNKASPLPASKLAINSLQFEITINTQSAITSGTVNEADLVDTCRLVFDTVYAERSLMDQELKKPYSYQAVNHLVRGDYDVDANVEKNLDLQFLNGQIRSVTFNNINDTNVATKDQHKRTQLSKISCEIDGQEYVDATINNDTQMIYEEWRAGAREQGDGTNSKLKFCLNPNSYAVNGHLNTASVNKVIAKITAPANGIVDVVCCFDSHFEIKNGLLRRTQ